RGRRAGRRAGASEEEVADLTRILARFASGHDRLVRRRRAAASARRAIPAVARAHREGDRLRHPARRLGAVPPREPRRLRRRSVVRSGAEAARRGGKRAVIDPLGGIPDEPTAEPEPQRIQRPPRPTTWALLIVLGVAFLAEALVGRDPAVENSVTLFRLGALYAPAVRDGDIWRIGSYALLHIGWVHLLVNAYALWILAPQLEITFGSNQTLGLFCATAIAGGGASALWSAYSGSARLAAGASGG